MKALHLPSIGKNFSATERSTIPVLGAMDIRLVSVHVPILHIHLYTWILGGAEKTYVNSCMDPTPSDLEVTPSSMKKILEKKFCVLEDGLRVMVESSAWAERGVEKSGVTGLTITLRKKLTKEVRHHEQ